MARTLVCGTRNEGSIPFLWTTYAQLTKMVNVVD